MNLSEVSIILIGMIAVLFKLEINYNLAIEYGVRGREKLRINIENFKTNPFMELKRYSADTSYYNNTWRIAAIGSSIICLLILSLTQILELNVPANYVFPFLWLMIFTILYNMYNFKQQHFLNFVNRSIQEALDYLSRTPDLVQYAKNNLANTAYKQSTFY